MKFSIFTPFYNYLDAADSLCDAILNQTYPDWEWIIFDDFSDNEEVLQKLVEISKRDCRIKLIFQEYKGQYYINFPLSYCSGDIILKQDSDDIPYPKLLEVYKHHYEKFPNVVSIGTSSHLSQNSFSGETVGAKYINYGKSGNYLESHKHNVYSHVGDCRSYRINSLPKDGVIAPYEGFTLFYGEDTIRTILLEDKGNMFALPRILHRYTMRSNSQSGSETIYNELEAENREKTDLYIKKIISESENNISSELRVSVEDYYDLSFDHLKNFYFSGIENKKGSHLIEYWSDNIFSTDRKKMNEVYFDHKIVYNERTENPKFIVIDSVQSSLEMIDSAIKDRDLSDCEITITSPNSTLESIRNLVVSYGFPFWWNVHQYVTIKIKR
jgi:glycosyltransferase involved in cell wall biosynthesis